MNPSGFVAAVASSLRSEQVLPPAKFDEAFYSTLAKWVVDSCLLLGATVPTAYQVAGLFVLAVQRKSVRSNAES